MVTESRLEAGKVGRQREREGRGDGGREGERERAREEGGRDIKRGRGERERAPPPEWVCIKPPKNEHFNTSLTVTGKVIHKDSRYHDVNHN